MHPRHPEPETPDRDAPAQPRLRLVGGAGRSVTLRFDDARTRVLTEPAASGKKTPSAPRPDKPSLDSSDPRHVLAARTRQLITGAGVVAPGDRAELIRMAHILGLTPFQANLIIAIVQDQTRRGESPEQASSLLAIIEPPQVIPDAPRWRVAGWCSLALLLELLLVILLVN